MPYGCLPLVSFLLFMFIIPFFFADLMLSAMDKLGLTPGTAVLAALGIFIGSLINLPLTTIRRDESVTPPSGIQFRFDPWAANPPRPALYTIIAVNVGGCIVPCLIVLYELHRIASFGTEPLILTIVAVIINIYTCYRLARPVPNVGMAIPMFVPGLVAAICGVVFYPPLAPAIAFSSGVFGPLIGADLMHLRDINKLNTTLASIGGAGTFDGIVLSGLLATLLA